MFEHRSIWRTIWPLAVLLALGHATLTQADVTVTITSDNAYVYGFGDVDGITTLETGVENCTAGAIRLCPVNNGPEQYVIQNTVNLASTYIYIAAWSDDLIHQGVLASFTDGTTTINSGLVNGGVGPQWEVYSTGRLRDTACGGNGCGNRELPTIDMATINTDIATANGGNLWRNQATGFLEFGELNDSDAGTFGIVCASVMPAAAQWMWRNPNPSDPTLNPFVIGGSMTSCVSDAQEYLLFRIGPIGPVLQSDGGCGFNVGKAKSYKTNMVRAFESCPSGPGLDPIFPVTNSETGSSTPSCALPYPLSTYEYNPCKGSCTVQIGSKKEKPCSQQEADGCCNCSIKSKCTGIFDADGVTPISLDDSGWALAMIWRRTIEDPDNGPMTVIDLPIALPYGTPSSGKISLKTDCNTVLDALGMSVSPAHSSTELVDVAIVDPQGNRFAVPGFSCCDCF